MALRWRFDTGPGGAPKPEARSLMGRWAESELGY